MKDTTLVVGATGNVGARVRRLLVEAGRPVRALSRDAHPEEAGVEWVRGDLTAPETLLPALDGVDAVFLVRPGLDTEHAREVAGILAERGAHVVYLSSAGIDDGRDEQADPVNAMRAEVERALDESGVKATRLRCTSFAASLLEWADQIREGPARDVFGEARRTNATSPRSRSGSWARAPIGESASCSADRPRSPRWSRCGSSPTPSARGCVSKRSPSTNRARTCGPRAGRPPTSRG
ncbi:SDR family oxidoreductase [Nocardiopsis alba]|uniref:SDR family oxidoreductase n=1 Tax=Nocardiopsis alba TaxID=53437 RepID=UPI0033A61D00